MRAPAASDNPVVEIIQRKIRDVNLSAPERKGYSFDSKKTESPKDMPPMKDVGFAKARGDIEWISDTQKHKE